MNGKEAVALLVGVAVILGAVLSVEKLQNASAADTGMMMDNIGDANFMKGQISSVQLGSDGQPAWIQSGYWVLRVFPTSDPEHHAVFLVAKMAMVKPDGMAMHSHSIFNFNATEMTMEGNSTGVLKGTATVTMKDGAVTGVPLTIKVFNNAVIGMWIGTDKVDGHFGTGPVYGTLSVTSQAMTEGMGGSMMGQSGTSTANTIKMSAKEVDEVYRWSTDDGINPTLKMTANANNVIQIQNPTDEKHELVIESYDTELATSGDIGPDSWGQLAFKPAMTGTFEYHCEYHPDTMKGTIEVVPSS